MAALLCPRQWHCVVSQEWHGMPRFVGFGDSAKEDIAETVAKMVQKSDFYSMGQDLVAGGNSPLGSQQTACVKEGKVPSPAAVGVVIGRTGCVLCTYPLRGM